MILIDYNQVIISNLMMQVNKSHTGEMNEDLIRHMVLNSIRAYTKQYKDKFGETVIACDGPSYWRKEYYPYYKAGRKKARDASALDWKLIFNTLDKIKSELTEFFPYRVINLPRTEADDVIGVLTEKVANAFPSEEVLILSSDKDFVQLQQYGGVSQFSPILKKFVKVDDPAAYLREHILQGDRGDGIPNFLSADRVFVDGGRQRPIRAERLVEWISMEPGAIKGLGDAAAHGYSRNERLVDLRQIPAEVQAGILAAYENAKVAPRKGLLNYFIAHRLKNLMEVIGDF